MSLVFNLYLMKKEYILYGVIAVLVLWIAVLLFDKFNNSDEVFEKTMECQKYLELYKDEHKDYDSEIGSHSYSNIWIFYSPIENSCIWYYEYSLNEYSGIYWSSYHIEQIWWTKKSYYNHILSTKNNLSCIRDSEFKNHDQNASCEENYETMWKEEIEWLKWN